MKTLTAENVGFGYRFEDEINSRNRLQVIFNPLCARYGSKPIEVPLVAPVNYFLGAPPKPLKEKDGHRLLRSHVPNGDAVTVRYEGTVLTAAYIAREYLDGVLPEVSRYHYFQEMVRLEASEDINEKRLRAFYQSGLEMFATNENDHRKNIFDTITFAVHYLSKLGETFRVRLSHVDIVQAPLRRAQINKYDRKRIIDFLEHYQADELYNLMKKIDFDKKLGAILLEIAYAGVCPLAKGLTILAKHPELYKSALKKMEDLAINIDSDVLANCCFDGGVNRSLDFYSGLTFQADLKTMTECMGGGEFSGLVEEFGADKPIYAVGLAAGVERLLQVSNS